tara:strand:+ start:774 stop:1331 length:558 start_codon:yes stop_codon:yes gene_type:complete
MSSQKFTMADVEQEEIKWRTMVAENEIRLLKLYAKQDLGLAYIEAERNAWILRTLRDKKQLSKLNSNPKVILVGSGMYPYSMFDLHKRNPNLKQIGIEIDESRARVSRKLIAASPAKEVIKIITMNALDFDYSWLGIDDLIFVSVDVDHKDIIDKILKTSKAHVYICAPYDKTWLKNLVNSIKGF